MNESVKVALNALAQVLNKTSQNVIVTAGGFEREVSTVVRTAIPRITVSTAMLATKEIPEAKGQVFFDFGAEESIPPKAVLAVVWAVVWAGAQGQRIILLASAAAIRLLSPALVEQCVRINMPAIG